MLSFRIEVFGMYLLWAKGDYSRLDKLFFIRVQEAWKSKNKIPVDLMSAKSLFLMGTTFSVSSHGDKAKGGILDQYHSSDLCPQELCLPKTVSLTI